MIKLDILFEKKIVINLFEILIFLFISSKSLIYGQSYPPDFPYRIDIKKNIKNITNINLSTLGTEISYLPLETTPECLIQEICNIDFCDSYIFIHDYDRILEFDRNGKFIMQIGSTGRGPKEYYRIYDFCIDEQKKEIYIISSPQLLSIFGFNGDFKISYKLYGRAAQIIPKDQNSLMYHLMNIPRRNNPSWIITNRQGITLTSIKNSLKRINQPGFIVLHTPLYLFANTIHFMEFGVDTLYYFEDTQRKPYAIFFLDDLKMDPDLLITPSMVKEETLKKLWIGSINENTDFMFTKFFRGITDATICAMYNKKADAVFFLKNNVFSNDVDGGIGFWPKEIINDKILIDYVDAFDLLKSTIPADLRKKLTETSNPVIIIVKSN